MTIDQQIVWVATGFVGQAFFAARFLVQWLYSEARGKSRVPNVFWYLSAIGGILLLSYAIHRKEVVFIIGETTTLVIFLRNLQLLKPRAKQ
ncbi:lipid-A-disaccharide synthase N-terminal domain-containing protein [Dyella psychrodurans]|uniref:Lipid A biosynthesis N-terminal domain-containing protein n=1 Tax=Dyella psychrodurans TaxID=1927960 RepID=A0A370X0U4_9GAMM|nr:lipid-A-disaccharide synthase N-terminal domain-containing protein [Dyella psychrodurans]RDS82023.1 hypothetical protein DWU99_16590 [Dyella psychrodurans]